MKNINFNKENTKSLAILAVIAVVTIILIVLIVKTLFGGNTVSNKELDNIVKNKSTEIIYVKNSDSKKCKKCSSIEKYLKSEKINYEVYDVNKVKDADYKEFLSNLNINSELFNYPAVIYIKNGVMYSNIINIDSNDTVKQFIKDYNLKKVTK